MALIDVVKFEQRPGIIAFKFPSSDLRWGTQLIVYPGQEAFFVKGGVVCDQFRSGTYTLKSNNLPLLNKIVNIPYGGDSPFQADVWFISLTEKLNLRWGTETPMQIEDPKYKIIIPVRSYGQWGYKIVDTEAFLNKILGNMPVFDEAMLQSYFRGVLLSKLSTVISREIIEHRISMFDINMFLPEIAEKCTAEISSELLKYGIEMTAFSVISINMPENDMSVLELKRAKNFKAELDVVGVENYKLKRTFDFLDKSAENESSGGSTLNWGLGLGTGLGAAKDVRELVGNALSGSATANTPPELPVEYFVSLNGEKRGPLYEQEVRDLINSKEWCRILIWKTGMPDWRPVSDFKEFNNEPENK